MVKSKKITERERREIWTERERGERYGLREDEKERLVELVRGRERATQRARVRGEDGQKQSGKILILANYSLAPW